VQFVAGTALAPSITWVGDTNTGLWSSGDGSVGVSSNGVNELTVDSTGITVPNGSVKMATESTVASAATCDIGAVASNSMVVTGTAAITSFGTTYAGPKFLRFAAALTLSHSANLVLPGAAAITTSAGDCVVVMPKATAGVPDGWVVVSYQYATYTGYRALLDVYSKAESDASATTIVNTAVAASVNSVGGLRNVVMNGNMSISQEFGTASTTITAGAALKYVVDGWYAACTGANVTVQQVFTNNKASLVVTGAASNTGVTLGHRIESADSYSMAGLFATLSLLVSSSTLTTVNWGLYYANSKDAFGTIATPTRTAIQTGSFTGITSSAALKSAITSAALSTSAHTGLEIVISCGALLGTQTLTITDVQLEKGSVASPVFENLSFDRQRQRARRRLREVVSSTGFASSTTQAVIQIDHEGMFAAPTPTATAALTFSSSTNTPVTQSAANVSIVSSTANGGRYLFANFTGLGAGGAFDLGTTGGKLLLSAPIP
jgi:hypothetical protein